MHRSVRFLLSLFFLFLSSLPLLAQEAPSFLIERIDVRGARFASERVVAREALLTPGRSYTEPQLRAALSRINRLPFVLDSTFALERGSDRGAYVLVVSIVETKPLFVEADSVTEKNRHSSPDTHNEEYIRSGVRGFIGGSSLVHLSTDFDDNYEAGITQYNLFGRPGYVTLNLRWSDVDGSHEFTDPSGDRMTTTVDVDLSPEVRFGIPIFGNHSLQGQWSRQSSNVRMTNAEEFQEIDQLAHAAQLEWVFDTTDDAVLPTRGTLWRSGVQGQRVDVDVDTSSDIQTFDGKTTSGSVFSIYTHYKPVSSWLSLMAGGGGGISRIDYEDDPRGYEPPTFYSFGPHLGLSASLWPDRFTRRFGDLRWETRANYTFLDGEDMAQTRYLRVTTSIVQRNVWGTLRLGFGYSRSEFN